MTTGLKILHVTPSFDSSAGGVAYALRNIAESLSPLGVAQTILTAGSADLSVEGVPVVRFPDVGLFRAHPDFEAWLGANVRGYDLVHIHSIWLFHSRTAANIARAAAVPYVISPCGMLDAWSMSQKAFKKRVYFGLFEKKVLSHAAALHCTVEAEARSRRIVGLGTPTDIIPLAIEEGFFRGGSPVSRNANQILSLGRLHIKKQPHVLISAFVELVRRHPELRLVIAGSGDDAYVRRLTELARPCRENIEFVGPVGGEEKIRLFRESGIFALPSLHENFGIVVAEAMAAGAVPVISNQVALMDVLLRHNAGFVSDPDVGSFGAALESALQHDAIDEVRANGQAYAASHYSQAAIGSQFMQFYRRRMGSAGASAVQERARTTHR